MVETENKKSKDKKATTLREYENNKELQKILNAEKSNGENLNTFFSTIRKYHWQSVLFCLGIFFLIIVLRRANSLLKFPETRSILNWFGFLVLANLLITYLIMISYRQVKNQKGIAGPQGHKGPSGKKGFTQNCGICQKEVHTMEMPFDDVAIKQPVLPEKLDLKPRGKLVPPEKKRRIKFATGKLPVNDTVYLWKHTNYRGQMYTFRTGNYPWIGRWRNDKISSLRVPEGYWCTLYQHANYRGRRQTYMPGNHRYVGGYMNDRTSSIKVYKQPSRHAVIFQHDNWKGGHFWASGNHSSLGWMNRHVTGIYVPNGYRLTVYSKTGYKGWRKTFGPGYYNHMRRQRWDNKRNRHLDNRVRSCSLRKV